MLLLAIGVVLGVGARALENEDGCLHHDPCTVAADDPCSADGHRRQLAGGSGSGSGEGATHSFWDLTQARRDYTNGIKTLATLNPHVLLFIFLPALLFESANAIDFHVFKKIKFKALTLAFPAMIGQPRALPPRRTITDY